MAAFKKSWMYVLLTKLCQHVNEMVAIVVKFAEFSMVQFSCNQTKY